MSRLILFMAASRPRCSRSPPPRGGGGGGRRMPPFQKRPMSDSRRRGPWEPHPVLAMYCSCSGRLVGDKQGFQRSRGSEKHQQQVMISLSRRACSSRLRERRTPNLSGVSILTHVRCAAAFAGLPLMSNVGDAQFYVSHDIWPDCPMLHAITGRADSADQKLFQMSANLHLHSDQTG